MNEYTYEFLINLRQIDQNATSENYTNKKLNKLSEIILNEWILL